MLNGKKLKGRICELEGKPIRDLIMCPCDVPLTQKFMCDEDCVYCGKKVLGIYYKIATIKCKRCPAKIEVAGQDNDRAFKNAAKVWNRRADNETD